MQKPIAHLARIQGIYLRAVSIPWAVYIPGDRKSWFHKAEKTYPPNQYLIFLGEEAIAAITEGAQPDSFTCISGLMRKAWVCSSVYACMEACAFELRRRHG